MFLTSRNSITIEFPKGIGGKNPKEDFFSYDAKFASRSGKDWLLLDAICSVFLCKSL